MFNFQKIIIGIFITIGLVSIYSLIILVNIKEQELDLQKKQVAITEEEHIDKLFSIYQNNIATCASQAQKNKKDRDYIMENCIKPINDSIIAQWLVERGYGDLLESSE